PAALAGALRRVRRRGLRAGRRAARRQCALRERGRGRAARQRRRPVHGHLPTATLTPDDGGRTTAGGGPPREGRAAGRGSGRGGTVVGQPSPRGGRESTIRLRAPTVSRVTALYSDSSGVPSGSAVSISAVQRSPYALGGSRKPTGAQWLLSSSRKESSTSRRPRGSRSAMASPLRKTPTEWASERRQSSSVISWAFGSSHTRSGRGW